ncbi:MAG TPA: hypothetical protein VHV27_01445 [Phenylobacterium sp.]|nr:hypothetical protein [Phenylobacterium sp.]
MKLPRTSTPRLAAALLGAMALAFAYQGFSKRFPLSFIGAAILLAGALLATRMAIRTPRA